MNITIFKQQHTIQVCHHCVGQNIRWTEKAIKPGAQGNPTSSAWSFDDQCGERESSALSAHNLESLLRSFGLALIPRKVREYGTSLDDTMTFFPLLSIPSTPLLSHLQLDDIHI